MAVPLCLAPLAGVAYLDLPLGQYLEFPPTTRYVAHAPFQWTAFLLLGFFVTAVCLPFLYRQIVFRVVFWREKASSAFPWWGWLGLLFIQGFWILAWNRFAFFRPLQHYTFFPLWIGYVLAVNGITFLRKGSCLLLSRPGFLAVLFPVSALFWWYFEYLNRFVQNWYYLMGPGPVSATEYVIHATVCFSTVLPAVISTEELLSTFARLAQPFKDWHPLILPRRKLIGWFLLVASTVALAGLTVFPDYLFPLIWIAPLLVIVGMQLATERSTIFAEVEKGNWLRVVLPALAALVCGFFWEMWNWKSLAHWEYSVPFVHRYQIFAMPLLGYAGYLPFGLECEAVVDLIEEIMPFSKG